MAYKDNFIDPTLSITDGGLINTEPEYQKMIPYVELYVVRNDRVDFLLTNEGLIRKPQIGDGIVSLMGINTLTNTYTTNYVEDINSDSANNFPDEGVGITEIDVDVKSRYVPKVSITIVDIKGSCIMNPLQLSSVSNGKFGGSQFSTIFDFPPPTYVLILKGAFGKAVRYILHSLSINVDYNAETGNFTIKLELIGKTFAPLSDIKMGWIKAAPYMLDDKKKLNGNVTDSVTSLWDLQIYGNQLYSALKELTSSSTEQETISNNNDKIQQLKDFQSQISEVDLGDDLKPINFQNQVINGSTFIIDNLGTPQLLTKQDNTSFNNINLTNNETTQNGLINFGFVVKVDSKDNDLINLVNKNLIEHKKTLLNDSYKLLVGGNIDENKEIQILKLYDVDQSGKDNLDYVRFIFDYSSYYNNINKKITSYINDNNQLNNDILNKSRDIVTQTSGFIPNIYNITKIIADDIDIFFNILNEAGDTERTAFNVGDTISVLEDGAFPQVTIKRNDTQYNIYPAADEIVIANPAFNDWKEVKFVEKFIETYLQQKTLEEEIEELKKINDDGSSKIIPVSPLDTNVLGNDSDLSYSNKLTDDEFLTNIFRRYFISTQYTNKGFWSTSFQEERRKSFIEFLANAEVQNIVSSITDKNQINVIKTFFEGLDPQNIFQSLETYFKDQNNKNQKPQLYNFLFNLDGTDKRSYNIGDNTIYSFSDNPEYSGLSIKEGYKPKIVDDTTFGQDDEKPTKYLLDFVNGSWYNVLSSREKPKLTTDNLIYFKDYFHKDDVTYNSDFINYNASDIVNYTLENKEDVNFFQFYINEINGEIGFINNTIQTVVSVTSLGVNNVNRVKPPKKVNNLTELENALFLYLYNYDDNDVENKFLYNGVIECIEIFLVKLGKQLKYNQIENTLKQKDKDLIISYYDKFVQNSQVYIDNYNSLFNKNNIIISELSSSELFKMFFNRIYLINNTAFTFLGVSDYTNIVFKSKENNFHALLEKDTDGNYIEKKVKFDTGFLGQTFGNEDDRFTVFSKLFSQKLINGLNSKLESKKQKQREIKRTIRDTDLKTQLYESFRSLYHRWLKAGKGYKDNNLSYPFSMGTALIEKFKFIDRGFNDIGKKVIVDFTDIIDRLQNGSDSEVYGTLSSFYSKNNFEFFVLPNFINYNNQRETWMDSFSITETTEIKTTPVFTCMYVGGYSSNNNDMIKTTDVEQVIDLTDNVYGFQVKVGKQNQTIFKDVKFNTSEFKGTGESLKMVDDIFNNINKNNAPLFKGQNLFEVYQNRSYSTTLTIPFGNMLIQPTQYFELFNVPLFNGLYIILGVQHKFSSSTNRLETTITGSRVRKYISPIVTSPIIDFNGVFSELTQIASLAQVNNVSSTTSVQPITLTSDDILYRKEENVNKFVVRQLNNGDYTNNTQNLTFTQQTVDRNSLGSLKIVDNK